MSRKFSIGGKSVMFLCVVSALVLLNRPLSSQSQQAGGDVPDAPAADETQLFTTLSGGALEQIRLRNSDTPITLGPAAAFSTIVGGNLPWAVPAFDSDLIHVSFNAECQLRRNGGVFSIFDWIEVRAFISAVPARAGYPKLMSPQDAASPRALCGSEEYDSVIVNWADRPTPVGVATNYTVTIQWRVVDNAPVGVPALLGWLDDWEISLRAYN